MDDGGLVRFVDVRKTYDGETLVIKNLNLVVHKGEFLTLLGPSGSGKTTTLMMLAGFELPTAGRIELDGEDLSRRPPYRRDFGMVFQDYSLFPHMTVAENVAFPLAARRRTRDEIASLVADALAMVKLGALGQRRPAQLSGGQQQRVALARALVFRPRLILMDEPLGALDKQLREQMQIEIKHIQRSLGITAVYVTHDQQEALTMSDRIAVFSDGRILQLDTPTALYERPDSAFVAAFIGENNRLDGRLLSRGDGLCVVDSGFGGPVVATPVDVDAVGTQVALMVRPERVVLDPTLDDGPNRFAATIEELIYQGDHMRARLRLSAQAEIVVKIADSRIGSRRELGASIHVGWRPEDCRVFRAA